MIKWEKRRVSLIWRRLSRARWTFIFDQITFGFSLLAGQLLALHGKAIAGFVFVRESSFLMGGYHHFSIYVTAVLLSLAFVLTRLSTMDLGKLASLSMLLVVMGAISVQANSTLPAMMVFFMTIYVAGVAGAIIVVEPIFQREMPVQFWKLFFDGLLRGVRYILILFTAGIAVLRYLSTGLGETPTAFLTTLFYPTAIMVFSIGFVAIWLLVPAWLRLVESYASLEGVAS